MLVLDKWTAQILTRAACSGLMFEGFDQFTIPDGYTLFEWIAACSIFQRGDEK